MKTYKNSFQGKLVSEMLTERTPERLDFFIWTVEISYLQPSELGFAVCNSIEAMKWSLISMVRGLGDVVSSLSRTVEDLNHHLDIILPKYNCMNLSNVALAASGSSARNGLDDPSLRVIHKLLFIMEDII
ncbi:hypothetical protein V2J09_016452 [Rumex salicifolius]